MDKERIIIPDVKLYARASSAGVVESNAHQDRRAKAAQRNIYLQTEQVGFN